uniref:glucose-6-phosphate isomerase n=1 Tax=uncultured Flavonifractor sp. TaxID=1193534 RepID=UPI002620B419|nr:glucose-6-phosphate isomerase [uncultured Flavonifractor sp.]
MIQIDTSSARSFLSQDWLSSRLDALESARQKLESGNGAGGSFTGWVHLPRDYDKEEFARIQAAAQRIRSNSQALVVIGIGGSYLGARAVVELVNSPNFNLTHKDGPAIYFAGNGLSTDAMAEVIDLVKDKDWSINVISKSGTTTEPAVAFRIFKNLLEEKYGKEEARKRIYATTDAHKGALKGLADAEGYEEFVVPDAIGGRYSVLTAVGLLPIACAGVDIAQLMEGAREEMEALAVPGEANPAWQHAAARHALYTAGKKVDILVGYEPSYRFFGEWWKQLYGESEGKEGKGLFPASVEFTADLHSMGQYIQQGERLMLETVVRFEKSNSPAITIPHDPDNVDGLNFLAGKDLSFVAEQAMRGTLLAHVDGGVPNLIVTAPDRCAKSVGALIYFFEYVCGLSGYLLEINPFDQPGVEAYKNNMYALLGKPGYEDKKAELEARLGG